MFKALSNQHRLKIFLRLAQCCDAGSFCRIGEDACECVGELGRNLGIVPLTVSHHIKELNRAGLILLKRNGRSIECRIDPEAMGALIEFFAKPGPVR